MANDDMNTPESLLPYDEWTQDALRQVIVTALRHTATNGLPGAHHFYITFKTSYPGVNIPDRLKGQYPDEMTIVLQHQFHGLSVDEAGQIMSVSLKFSGVPSTLVIPIAAISGFADPEVRFGLQFHVDVPEAEPTELSPPRTSSLPPLSAPPPTPAPEGPAGVVSLDAFRRRQKD